MKEHTENKNHSERCNAKPSFLETDEAWFNRFEDRPGIYDSFTAIELETMKKKMLSDFKKKINKLD